MTAPRHSGVCLGASTVCEDNIRQVGDVATAQHGRADFLADPRMGVRKMGSSPTKLGKKLTNLIIGLYVIGVSACGILEPEVKYVEVARYCRGKGHGVCYTDGHCLFSPATVIFDGNIR